MEQIAWMIGNTNIYWSSVIRVLAVGTAVCCLWALYLKKSGNVLALAVGVPLAIVLSLVAARITHWYFLPGSYAGSGVAWNPMLPGGLALMGAFAGCFLAAALVRLLCLTRNLPELLDCLCIAGSLGIALGRLGAWFGSADRGMMVPVGGWEPWVSGVFNPVSGAEELRLSVFLLQAAAAGILFLGLLIWYLADMGGRKDGDAALIFLLCYGAAQVLLDSMRYDSLHFRSNGFVSAAQVLSALAMAFAAVVFTVRLVRSRGWKKWYALLWTAQAGCFGLAGYMEYYVQRHGDQAVAAYSGMGLALLGIVAAALWSRSFSIKTEEQ